MEQLNFAVSVVVGTVVVLMALRLSLRAIDKRELQYSADYCRSIEEKGVVFDAKFAQCMTQYEQLGNQLTDSLLDDFSALVSEIKDQITNANANMCRMVSQDQKVVISYRTTWRRYEKDIQRIITLKV